MSKYMMIKERPDKTIHTMIILSDRELRDHIGAMFEVTDHKLLAVVRIQLD